MANKRKLRRFGSRTYGLSLTGDMLELLGTSVEEAESDEGAELEVKFYGDTLIARKVGSPPLTPAELAYFITEDMEFAKYFPSSEVVIPETKLKPRLNINALFKPGKAVEMTKTMQKAVRAIAELGPMTGADFTEQTGVHARQATRVLRTGYEEGIFVRDGIVYSLNPEIFNV